MRMRGMAAAGLLLAAALMAAGCGGGALNGGTGASAADSIIGSTEPPGMEGYVVADDGGRKLVVDPNAKDLSADGGVSEFYEAIWFSDMPEHVRIGQKVQVWFDAVAESYPGQSKALKVVVLTSPKPKGADLSEAEAIEKALTERPFTQPIGIRSAEYDPDEDLWNISIRSEGETIEMEVKDSAGGE